jgi:hypothetical protein
MLSIVAASSQASAGLVANAPNIEDMNATADGEWIIASGMAVGKQPGAIRTIDARTKTVYPLYPLLTGSKESSGSPTDTACSSEVAPQAFAPHGLTLHESAAGRLTLYVVNHGTRESIETFAVTLVKRSPPKLTWTGCIQLPPGTMANSVTIGSDGTVFVTAAGDAFAGTPRPSGADDGKSPIPSSGVLGWNQQGGWRQISTGPLALSNGIVSSKDGRYLYVAEWLGSRVLEVDLKDPSSHRTVQLDFLPDNLRRDADGFIWVAGQSATMQAVMDCYLSERTRCGLNSGIAKLDPHTMAVACSQSLTATPEFSSATVALPLQKEVWIGSFRDRAIATKALTNTRGQCFLP